MDISAIQTMAQNVSTFLMALGAAIFLPILIYEIVASLVSVWSLPRLGILKILGLGILLIVAPGLATAFTALMVAG